MQSKQTDFFTKINRIMREIYRKKERKLKYYSNVCLNLKTILNTGMFIVVNSGLEVSEFEF